MIAPQRDRTPRRLRIGSTLAVFVMAFAALGALPADGAKAPGGGGQGDSDAAALPVVDRDGATSTGTRTAANGPLAPTQPATLVNNPLADTVNPSQDTQSETTIVRASGNNLVAAFNDSNSFNANEHFTGYSTSADGGQTWTDRGALPTDPAGFGDAGDPVLAYSKKTGTVFLATLAFDPSNRIQVFRSTDNGATFGPPVDAAPGTVAGAFLDKEWIAVDNVVGAAGSGYGNAYAFMRSFGGCDCMLFSRSTNDGASFSPPIVLAGGGQGAYVAVGVDHSVYAFWLDGAAGNVIKVRRSTDGGVTFAPAVNVVDLATTGGNGALPITPMRSNSFVHAGVNPVTGHLYAVFSDDPAGADNASVYLAKSIDGGASWSAPVAVNTDSSGRDQFFPTIAVADEGNRAIVSWYDRRNDPANSQFQRFSSVLKINGSTVNIGKNFFSSPFSPAVVNQDPVINQTYMGDYDHATQTTSNFVFSYSDNRDSNSVHANQPDVRAGIVPKSAAAADLGVNVSTSSNPVALGASTTLTINVTNNGTSAITNAGLVSQLTGKLAVSSISAPSEAACSRAGTTLGCSFPSIGPGITKTVTVVAIAIGAGPIDSKSTVSHPGGDSVSANNTKTLSLSTTGSLSSQTNKAETDCAIVDLITVDCPLTIGTAGTVLKVEASIRLDHTFDSDLQISLVSPGGVSSVLVNRRGGSGDNFGTGAANPCDSSTVFTVLKDSAATSVSAGVAPFASSFKPEESLGKFALVPRAGTWKLRITDVVAADVGNVLCWKLKTYTP